MASFFLPWWHISGLGPKIQISPLFLLNLALGRGGEFIQVSEGFTGLIFVASAFVLIGGLVGLLRGFTQRKFIPFIGGLLIFSAINILSYAFVYLKVAGSTLCLNPSIIGAPVSYGFSYGFVLVGASGLAILASTFFDI